MDDAELLRQICYEVNHKDEFDKSAPSLDTLLMKYGFEGAWRTGKATDGKFTIPSKPYTEHLVYRDDSLVAIFHRFEDETFLFLWTPELAPVAA